jgi:sporulation protein YlmC with PRC-barrel domain
MKLKTLLAAGLATTALGAAPAIGQSGMDANTMKQAHERYEQAMNETVSAERMMSGDVTNGFNQLGDVRNLILDPTGQRIEYILYDVPYPWSFYGGDDGFVRWDNVAIERGGYDGLDLRIDDDAADYRKEQLELTRAEADGRMVDKILDGDMMFADREMRGIEDILFDPETGMVTHYVVEFDENSLFDEDTRLVPASMVRMDDSGDYWMVSRPTTYEYEVWVY